MTEPELNVVTGAFGYTGRHITTRLLARGKRVRTVTGHPDRENPFGDAVEVVPYNFDNPDELARSLEGATTLYNTYWIRFERGGMTHAKAVENSRTLIKAAENAGLKRIVHTSITNPDINSRFSYYKGKAEVEEAIISSRLSHAILRPNVLFGDQGILINNIAWMLRRFPVFIVPGDGRYEIHPIFVEDYADLAVELGRIEENVVLDAVGPEVFRFNDLLAIICDAVGRCPKIIHANPEVALFFAKLTGYVLGDVMLTRDEVGGLLNNLLVSSQAPTGHTPLSLWLKDNADWIGRSYMSEVSKHFR